MEQIEIKFHGASGGRQEEAFVLKKNQNSKLKAEKKIDRSSTH